MVDGISMMILRQFLMSMETLVNGRFDVNAHFIGSQWDFHEDFNDFNCHFNGIFHGHFNGIFMVISMLLDGGFHGFNGNFD